MALPAAAAAATTAVAARRFPTPSVHVLGPTQRRKCKRRRRRRSKCNEGILGAAHQLNMCSRVSEQLGISSIPTHACERTTAVCQFRAQPNVTGVDENEENMNSCSTDVKENRHVGNNMSITEPALGLRSIASIPANRGSTKRKKPLEEDSNGSMCPRFRPKKRRRAPGPAVPKNALMQLNEVKPGLQYRMVNQVGPVHAPVFIMAVEVNGQTFEGSGSTKKKAKLQAAEKALRSFVQFPNACEAHIAMGQNTAAITDFTSDLADVPGMNFNKFDLPGESDSFSQDSSESESFLSTFGLNGFEAKASRSEASLIPAVPSQQPSNPPYPLLSCGKNPLMILNEMRPGLRFDFVAEIGESHARNFVMAVTVDGQTFQGFGRNKKLAKARAAQAVLQGIFNLQLDATPGRQPIPSEGLQLHLPQVLADTVASLVQQKFSDLTEGFTSPHARRKVLAGIVMTAGLDVKDAQVISVATGTKCINGEYMSDRGLALNDCHAEIVARRALLRYLYTQLELHFSKEEEKQTSIFVALEQGGFKLKEDIQFHLYISTSPCGDARIFSPHEASMDGDKHPNRKARGQLRTKIESGEGTIPVRASGAVQTWDGVLQGERLLTMSCSDKIARWNVLGIQGSLLSHLMKPIYLNSVILGSLYHGEHLSRAAYQRISDIWDLPSPYKLNRPMLSGISNAESRQAGKAPSFSANWSYGDGSLEVINATTGKNDLGRASRLSKHALFSRWLRVNRKLNTRIDLKGKRMNVYCEAKLAAEDYQGAKRQLNRAFHKASLGAWMKKPIEQDQFSLSV
ncbi:double-stranded RNA-specific editase 1 isoform X2 [Petromyzon marinus]|uniref:double-stranded RNA-specific editase 1 isoform X2 n=1 Tax=Petromyzon marinus TaxID=7757 RepID=UPI003F704A3B